ncbi:MAG: phage portal protein [Romboutsia sp.]|jgi:HK97 family phage portal protein
MDFSKLFKKKDIAFERVNYENLSSILNEEDETSYITRNMALQIPSLKSGVSYISDLVSSLEIKLYKETSGKVETIEDYRLKMLNDDTGDMLNSFQMKQSMVRDFILSGNGYTYINKYRNKIKSLHYVVPSRVSVISDSDIIFKKSKINVDGKYYDTDDFIIVAQNTTDGVTGKGILEENNDLIKLSYNTLSFSSKNMAQGGIKRGVLKSSKRLTEEAMNNLKQAWSKLYSANNSSAIILNEGLDFQELSQTSAELEILNTRQANDKDILNMIKVPSNILDGTANNDQYNNFIKSTIYPILSQLETALNKSLLLEEEKDNGYFFGFETKDLLKGSAKERFETYKAAIESGVLTQNECRFMENYENLDGLDVIKMSLGHVLFNPSTKEYYVPNTGQVQNNDNNRKAIDSDGNKAT